MYKMKYIFGQTIKYKGTMHKVMGIRFTVSGVMYSVRIDIWTHLTRECIINYVH